MTKGGTVTAPPFVMSVVSRSLEGVLDLLAGGLEVSLALLDLALGLQVLVVGGVARGALRLADESWSLAFSILSPMPMRSS